MISATPRIPTIDTLFNATNEFIKSVISLAFNGLGRTLSTPWRSRAPYFGQCPPLGTADEKFYSKMFESHLNR